MWPSNGRNGGSRSTGVGHTSMQPRHRAIQNRIKEVAEKHGIRAIIERPILDGGSQVDVVLDRGGVAWACQIATGNNSVDHEFGQVRNCFKAGFSSVVVIAMNIVLLKKLESAVAVTLGPDMATKVGYYLPDAFIEQIPKLAVIEPQEPTITKSHGYVVTVETVVLSAAETKLRERAALEAYANSVRKKRRKK